MIGMNVAYALTAYPAGALSDRIGRRSCSLAGIACLVVADLGLGFTDGYVALGIGVAFWGLHMGLTQGVFSAMVADAAPLGLRGTAFGVYYAASGVATLVGQRRGRCLLWDRLGAPAPFFAGAILAAITLAVILVAVLNPPAVRTLRRRAARGDAVEARARNSKLI